MVHWEKKSARNPTFCLVYKRENAPKGGKPSAGGQCLSCWRGQDVWQVSEYPEPGVTGIET